MDKATQTHLENVTPEILERWREENAFASFASSTGRNGHVELGIDGTGLYVVKDNGKQINYHCPATAIKRYTKLIS